MSAPARGGFALLGAWTLVLCAAGLAEPAFAQGALDARPVSRVPA